MGNKTQTSTSQQTSTPVNQAALQSIYGQVANAASTPYTPYGGELTAGINGQQTAGINTINAGANAAQPYYAQAGQLASGAANPLTAAQIAQYQNPYTQSVVNATQAQFNDQNGQQQNSLKGTAAQQGALGGDRQAVAQSQLAGQQQLSQAPVIAGLYANSYNSGLQTAAQQYQQNPLAAASSLAGIGSGAQNAALSGGAAQLAAGTQQQQTQQASDTANYQQYLAQQANPYQNAAFLEQYGLPAALGQGSTSSGTQTAPGPNTAAQIAGLGIAGAGLFLKDGGRVGFYTGGAPGYVNSKAGYLDSGAGYIPATQASQNTLQAPQLQFAKPQSSTANPLQSDITALNGLKGKLAGSSTPDYGQSSNINVAGYSMPQFGNSVGVGDYSMPTIGFHAGGLVDAIHQIHKTIKRSRGGAVSNPFQAYADGGTADDPGIAERLSRKMNNGRDQGQRALYNATRDGIYSSETRPEQANPSSIFSGLSDMRKYDGLDAQRIEDKVRGFADGGDTTFDDRFSAAADSPFGDLSRGQAIGLLNQSREGISAPRSIGGNDPVPPTSAPVVNPDTPFRLDPGATQEWRAGVDQPNPAVVADSGMPNADGTAPNPMIAPQSSGLPPQITNPDNAPDAEPSSALAYSGGANPMQASAPQDINPTPSAPEQQFGHSLFGANISDKTRQSLVAAGLGIMASRSPFALTALGEGGLQGLKSYSDSNKAEQEAQDKAVTQRQNQTRIDQEAQRIAQGASQFAKTNARADRAQDEKGQMTDYQKAEVDRQKRDEELKLKTPIKIGEDVSGRPIMALPRMNTDTNKIDLYPIDRAGNIAKDPVGPGSSIRQAPPVDPNAAPQAKPDPAAPVGSPASRNQSFIGQVEQEDPSYAASIKKAADYELDPAKYASMRSDKRQKFINDVIQYDPNYNPQETGLRYRAQSAYLPGTENGKTISAFNTAISHLDTLKQMYKALNNGDVQTLNHIKNSFQQEFGYPAPNDVSALSSIIGGEVVKATVGSQNALGDREEVRQSIGRDLSSKQADSVIDKYQALMAGQLNARKFAYEQSTGLHNFEDKFLLPRSKDVLRSVGNEGSSPASTLPTAPKGVPAGSAYSPSRKQWRDPSGQIYNADGSKA